MINPRQQSTIQVKQERSHQKKGLLFTLPAAPTRCPKLISTIQNLYPWVTNSTAEFQLNRTTNTHWSELLIKNWIASKAFCIFSFYFSLFFWMLWRTHTQPLQKKTALFLDILMYPTWVLIPHMGGTHTNRLFIRTILKLRGVPKKSCILSVIVWFFNPFTFTIGTRGNCEPVVCAMVLWIFICLMNGVSFTLSWNLLFSVKCILQKVLCLH